MSESIAEAQPASLTETLEAAFEDYDPANEPEVESEVAEAPVEDVESEAAPEEAPEEEAVEEPVEHSTEAPEEVVEEEPEGAQAPEHWSAEHRELFNEQPPEVQEFLLNRHKEMEGDYTRKMQDLSPLKQYQPIDEMFAPYKAQLDQAGQTPMDVIQGWASIDRAMQQNPLQALNYLAQQYGVNLKDDVPEIDPQINSLQNEIQSLRTDITRREQEQIDQSRNTLMTEIEEFASRTTEAGDLAHPYFDEVMEDMVALARAAQAEGQKPAISDLYDKAVWMNTSAREKLQAAQRDAAEKQKAEEARKKAAQAKKAAKTVTGSPSGSSPSPELGLRETLESNWE